MTTNLKHIYLDPPSKAYYEDRLFDQSNPILNRDDTLTPFIRLRDSLKQQGITVHTADLLLKHEKNDYISDYYSFGILDNYEQLKSRSDVNLRAFIIFEPPVVDPRIYKALPKLTADFDQVYIHNINGDGYSLKGVDQSKLRKLYWPQPYKGVLLNYWERENRDRRIVMINGNHKPASSNEELYSKRIEALAALAQVGAVDLYGRGWERWWSRNSMWMPYWLNRKVLMSIYKGACESKYEVLSQYSFALCFENMAMEGYITEKIFDCLYAGTIPLYLGAKDISDLIPEDAYIDCRRYSSWIELWEVISTMSSEDISKYREAGRRYIESDHFLKHYNTLEFIVC